VNVGRDARVYLGLAAIGFGILGVQAILGPGSVGRSLGFAPQTVSSLSEIRATYGGLQLAIAVLAVVGLLRVGVRLTAVAMVMTVCGGLAVGRAVSLVADGRPSGMVIAFWALEVTTTISGAALMRSRRDPSAERCAGQRHRTSGQSDHRRPTPGADADFS